MIYGFSYFVEINILSCILCITGIYCASQVFGRYGSVRVDIGDSHSASANYRWGSSWPEGIKLSSNAQTTVPNALKFSNATGYPYSSIAIATKPIKFETMKVFIEEKIPKQIAHPPRTFMWKGADELVINCLLSSSSFNPTCTRLAPPPSWLNHINMKVSISDSPILNAEILVSKQRVESNLGHLRSIGMTREEIFRTLDKGPWILAFDLSTSIPKLSQDIQACFGSNQSTIKHIVSHCPFLVAQYSRFKGRDIFATVMILNEIKYFNANPIDDILRFPTILATPPQRLRGWISLLQHYGVCKDIKLFGKMLRRAPFMFYRDAASVFYEDESDDIVMRDKNSRDSSIVRESKIILDILSSYQLTDLDKIVRTLPEILLISSEELEKRINCLLKTLSKESFINAINEDISGVASSSWSSLSPREMFGQSLPIITAKDNNYDLIDDEILDTFRGVLQTYPGALSIHHEQMQDIAIALRSTGLSRTEISYLIKSYPSILKKSPEVLKSLVVFLKSYCGFRKSDIVPSIAKYPNLLSVDVETLKPKVDYLYKSMGGTSIMLRKYPNFLCFDLETCIKPRAEFLKTFNRDPVSSGLSFLVNSSPKDLATIANVDVTLYDKFHKSFSKLSIKQTTCTNI